MIITIHNKQHAAEYYKINVTAENEEKCLAEQ